MKKLSKKDQAFLDQLMSKYNDFSELVALNYKRNAEEGTLQWNRGILYHTKDLLDSFSKLFGVKLVYTSGTHPFLEEELDYITVVMEGQDPRYFLQYKNF